MDCLKPLSKPVVNNKALGTARNIDSQLVCSVHWFTHKGLLTKAASLLLFKMFILSGVSLAA